MRISKRVMISYAFWWTMNVTTKVRLSQYTRRRSTTSYDTCF